MNKSSNLKKSLIVISLVMLLGIIFVFAIDSAVSETMHAATEYPLPAPLSADMILEESICMRKSIRDFAEEPVADEELSTVLWAAYGLREDGRRTVAPIDDVHAAVMYVLKKDTVYKYNALNHSLVFHKEGDYRIVFGNTDIYMAPVQLVLCWDTGMADALHAAAEIGEIGQNIALMAASLGLGTVVTAQFPPALEHIGLPQNETGLIMMPLGHLRRPYDFIYTPNRISSLPDINYSDVSLSTALLKRNETNSFGGTLSEQEQVQLLWSSYGYSCLIENQAAFPPRHRTVPSPHYTYDAVLMYVITESGIYRYSELCNFEEAERPVETALDKVVDGDKRHVIAQACSQPAIASAPLTILSVLDIEKSSSIEYVWPLWYFVAGASAHTILLEAAALNLTANIFFPKDVASVLSLLGLNDDFHPLLVVPVGKYGCPATHALQGHSREQDLSILRKFRDEVLSKTPAGREIIRLYYEWSPAIVKSMEEDEQFKAEVKEMICGALPLIKKPE